ncbi:MAG: Gfo/Idh/MocA family oxidoreductase [Planctomycetes bacterium]|nr:Gfo/Idh/MocA family oxidoreductase [Planctomycetota bacterium]
MIRFGVIGCGHWGRNYVRVLSELGDAAKLVEICDENRAGVDGLRKRFPLVNATTSADQVINNPEIEAVVIATPAATHAALAEKALTAGKHVLLEKPLASTLKDAVKVGKVAQEKGRTLMVGHTFRYNDGVRKLKELIGKAEFGKPYYMSARRNHLGLIRPDVSAVWDLAPHDIEIFTFLAGAQPVTVSAVGACFLRPGRQDVAFATLTYPSGVIGNIQVSWIDSNKVREVVVIGDRQRVVFDDLNPLEPVRIYDKGAEIQGDVNSFGEFKLQLRDGDIRSPKVEMREPLRSQIEHFIDCIVNKKTPLTGGGEGADVVAVLEAIDRSMAAGGAPAQVENWRKAQEPAKK